MIEEQEIIERMQAMCEESLCPETFEKWEAVRVELCKTRRELKGQIGEAT